MICSSNLGNWSSQGYKMLILTIIMSKTLENLIITRSICSSVNFHPTENLIMTTGLDRKAKLFSINRKKSHKV